MKDVKEDFAKTKDKQGFLLRAFETSAHRLKMGPAMALHQVGTICSNIGLKLSTRMLNQLYFTALSRISFESNKDIAAALQGTKQQIDYNILAGWLSLKLKEGVVRWEDKEKTIPLPPSNKLQPPRLTGIQQFHLKLQSLTKIFQEMETIREKQEFRSSFVSESTVKNKTKLLHLRSTAEQNLKQIFELAKGNPGVQVKLTEAIDKFQKGRKQSNDRVGRENAKRAQERLWRRNRDTQQKFAQLDLECNNDLVKAARVKGFLTLPQVGLSKLLHG